MERPFTKPRHLTAGRVASVVLALAATGAGGLLVAPGCLVLGGGDPPVAQGIIAGASCMCATCFATDFCMNASGDFIVNANNACEGNTAFPIHAVPASEVDSLTMRSNFFCVPDSSDLNVDWMLPTCPGTTHPGSGGGGGSSAGGGGGGGTSTGGGKENSTRVPLEHIGCHDAPVRCLSAAEQAACGLVPGQNDPPCPFQPGTIGFVERTACGDNMGDESDQVGEINSAAKVIGECELYGSGVPKDKPARYCFASCLDETWLHGSCRSIDDGGQCTYYCDPNTFHG